MNQPGTVATSTIKLGTGILILARRNPVVIAKQAATLDVMSSGRLRLGVGIGWLEEEFDALGVPFERRGARTEEYIAGMRALWSEGDASFEGEFASFAGVRSLPWLREPADARSETCGEGAGSARREARRRMLQPDRHMSRLSRLVFSNPSSRSQRPCCRVTNAGL